MAAQYSINVSFNAGNVGKAYNVFYMEWNTIGSPPDSLVLSTALQWVNRVYSALRPVMSQSYVHAGTRVDEVDDLGVVVRHIGTISPTVNGTAVADANSGPTAMSGLARTAIPKVRGSKRFPGVTEVGVSGQLLTNVAASALAQAVADWLAVDNTGTSFWRPGVMSSLMSSFVPFSNSGMVTNVPGTQVTRKPFRGA